MVDDKGFGGFGDFTPNVSVLVGNPARVPNLINQPAEMAQSIAQQAGFTMTIVSRKAVKGVNAATVVWQYPAPGSLASRGTTIDVVIDIPENVP